MMQKDFNELDVIERGDEKTSTSSNTYLKQENLRISTQNNQEAHQTQSPNLFKDDPKQPQKWQSPNYINTLSNNDYLKESDAPNSWLLINNDSQPVQDPKNHLKTPLKADSNPYFQAPQAFESNLAGSKKKSTSDLIGLYLGENFYQIPRGYLNQHTVEWAATRKRFIDLPFMLCLDSFDPPQERLFHDDVLKIEAEISYADQNDRDYLHFINIWDHFFYQKGDRKPQYFYHALYGYQWGRLNDLIEWFGLISLPEITIQGSQASNEFKQLKHFKNFKPLKSEADSIAVYGKTTGQILRIFVCWISKNLVIDFNVPNYKLPSMLELAYKMVRLVNHWQM
jgi:hypothetical protein